MKLKLSFIYLFLIFLTSCSSSKAGKKSTYKIFKKNVEASYYADKFNGRKTASGALYDNSKLTAAHRDLYFGTKLRVTNTKNNKTVDVVINDRGPFKKSREIDLSKAAFIKIAADINQGIIKVNIEIIN